MWHFQGHTYNSGKRNCKNWKFSQKIMKKNTKNPLKIERYKWYKVFKDTRLKNSMKNEIFYKIYIFWEVFYQTLWEKSYENLKLLKKIEKSKKCNIFKDTHLKNLMKK